MMRSDVCIISRGDVDDRMWVEGMSIYLKRVAGNGIESVRRGRNLESRYRVVSEYEHLQQTCRFFMQLASE